jgi:hypothetical protein
MSCRILTQSFQSLPKVPVDETCEFKVEKIEQPKEWFVANPVREVDNGMNKKDPAEMDPLDYQINTFCDVDTKNTSNDMSAYTCVGINVFHCYNDLTHIASKVASLKEHISSVSKDQGEPEFLIFTWLFKSYWSKEQTCVVHLFRKHGSWSLEDDSGFARSLKKFLKMSEKEQAANIKFAAKFRVAPSMVKTAIQKLDGEKPVKIGTALTTKFFKGSNYLEIDIDVGSSTVASMLSSTILKCSSGLVVEESFLLDSELSDRLLGSVRLNYVDLHAAKFELDTSYKPQ